MMCRKHIFVLGWVCLIVGILSVATVFYKFRTDIELINTGSVAEYGKNITNQKSSEDVELGDNYVFNYLYCGTACQGFSVRDKTDGALYSGVISYVYNQETGDDDIVLQDWYGRVYKFEGPLNITVSYYKGHVIFGFDRKEVAGTRTIITEIERVNVPIKPPHWSDLWTILTL